MTSYTYRDPVYDGRQREFRGFSQVSVRKEGDSNSPSSTTTSTFALGQCVADENGVNPCTPETSWMDNPEEALKGLPLVSETFDDHGVYLSTEHHTYTLRRVYLGLDGREVRYAFESASDKWQYDTAKFQSATQSANLPDAVLDFSETPSGPLANPTVLSSAPTPIRSTVGTAHLHSEKTVDPFGNAVTSVDKGCVEGCWGGQPDEVLTATTIPTLIADWIWRTGESYVSGSSPLHPGIRKDTTTNYDATGAPVSVSMNFQKLGNVDLVRSHAVIGAPYQANPPDTITKYGGAPVTVSRAQFDPVGNPVAQSGVDGRCRTVAYDEAYEDFVVEETDFAGNIASGGQCGSLTVTSVGTNPLQATTTYDRGLGAVTSVTDLNGAKTVVTYDGFGRLTQMFKPSPEDGTPSLVPHVLIDYIVGAPYSQVHTQTQNNDLESDPTTYANAYGYIDGFGRTFVTLQDADTSAGDGGSYIANGFTVYDAKGAAQRAYRPWFFSGDPTAYPITQAPTTSYGSQRYDAFGRQVETFNLDGSITLKSVYHALSKDLYDAADLAPGPHQGTYASARTDGHGRATGTTERAHAGNQIEARETQTQYLPSGPPEVVNRVRCGNADCSAASETVTRWMAYDSQDRLLLNMEPNTASDFTPGPTLTDAGYRAWRYAYDDAGDLIATSDARGCGVNYAYDAAGRILGEDYSPCDATQPVYTDPSTLGTSGFEVLYIYDDVDFSSSDDSGCGIPVGNAHGRLTAIYDRASHTRMGYDRRGRSTCVARQLAKPYNAASPATSYADKWFYATTQYDTADRPTTDETGTRLSELQNPISHDSKVTTHYSRRGTVTSVDGSYGTLVSNITHDADGVLLHHVLGDIAKTTTDYTYDTRRRVHSVQTYRGPPSEWSAGDTTYLPAPSPNGTPSSFQLLLEDLEYTYDNVDNPTEIRDWRTPSEWPAGAQPVTRKIQYDDLYRVSRIDYQYPAAADPWTSPFAFENDPANATSPHLTTPAPQTKFDNRVAYQTNQYDWLGNTEVTDDDAHGFYDRSLGTITNGTGSTPTNRYQLTGANNATQGGTKTGSLAATYDGAGNLTALTVNRTGHCVPSNAPCDVQGYAYQWDEVGRLSQATSTNGNDTIPATKLVYTYDAHDQRVRKDATDANGTTLYTAYIFDSLELRQATFDGDEYEDTADTERVYLSAHGVRLGRVEVETSGQPAINATTTHVLLELQDHLGSTSLVVDQGTSELVEAATYLGYGAKESDYRPGRWEGVREDYGFTGKEEDAEVGLTYFGRRFLSAYLGRWISADPLAVHSPGRADHNVYAYVHGALLSLTDPVGLDPKNGSDGAPSSDAQRSAGTATTATPPTARDKEKTVALAASTCVGVLASCVATPAGGAVAAAVTYAVLGGVADEGDTGDLIPILAGGLVPGGGAGNVETAIETRTFSSVEKLTVEELAEFEEKQGTTLVARNEPKPAEPASKPPPPDSAPPSVPKPALTAAQIGARGEQAASDYLKKQGYTDIGSIQNKSGHGIDLFARNPNGELEFFEVKSTTGTRPPKLSADQAKGAPSFVSSRLDAAINGKGAWKSVDAATRSTAESIRDELAATGATPRGSVLHVTNVGKSGTTVTNAGNWLNVEENGEVAPERQCRMEPGSFQQGEIRPRRRQDEGEYLGGQDGHPAGRLAP